MSKKKDRGIPLSPKHGVNPTLMKCFWCGGDMGVALLGKLKGDAEAPHEACLSLEPCDKCKANMAKGVTVIEIDGDGSRFGGNKSFAFHSPDGELHWPSGRFAVLKEGTLLVSDLKKGQRAFCDKKTMDSILSVTGETEKKGKGGIG